MYQAGLKYFLYYSSVVLVQWECSALNTSAYTWIAIGPVYLQG